MPEPQPKPDARAVRPAASPNGAREPVPGGAGDEQKGKSLIIKRERHRDDDPTPLAFVIDEQGQQPEYSVTVARWSEAASAGLKRLAGALDEQTPRGAVPKVGLRGRLELADQSNLRLDRELGFYDGTILWTAAEALPCGEALNNAVLEWLVNDAATHARSEAAQQSVAQLKSLARTRRAVETSVRTTNPYQWDISPGKTARAVSRTSYADLADYVARQLEGKAVFPGLSALRRIAGGQLDQNQAELMTEPIHVGRSRFSLVVRLRVFSYAGRALPVITIHFSRRVWTSGLKDTSSANGVSGYALPDGASRVFRFTVRKMKDQDGSWSFQPDADFDPIRRRYFPGKITVERILKEGHRLPQCKLLVALKHGAGERSQVKSGIPDLDKMDGFRGIADELAAIGLKPWQGLRQIKSSARAPEDHGLHWARRDSESASDRKKYRTWLTEAQDSIRDCYVGGHHLIIAVQPGYDVEADAKFAEERLQSILGDSVVTERVPISPLVHGPRNDLPGKELKNPAERAALRIAEWSQFIETVRQREVRVGRKVDGVLVIARKWYPYDQGKKHDDNVNQRAARIALAAGLGVPVQYLLPREALRPEARQEAARGGTEASEQTEDKIDRDFENRLMIAWLDLAYKSLGRVRPGKLLPEATNLYGNPDQSGSYPDRVLALGVVRRNRSRFLGNERSFLPYAIELDVESGVCSASFAYEDPETGQPVCSDFLPLPQALVTLAGLGPVPLSNEKRAEHRKALTERTQAFFKDRLADFGRRSLRPLVIIDADTSRSVWPWLTDDLIDPNNVHLGGGFHAEAAWPNARLVRVRTDNSPKVLWDSQYFGEPQDTGEVIHYHAPAWAEAQLFNLTDTAKTHVYLSFGGAIRTGLTKGRSSYRELPGMKLNGKLHKYEAAIMERHSDAWATPTGLEILVVRPHRDNPDQVARFVEWLRQCYAHFGAWTLKPAPLFFERVLKEYIADYSLGEDEDQEGEEDEEE